jgi:hypothetical protein
VKLPDEDRAGAQQADGGAGHDLPFGIHAPAAPGRQPVAQQRRRQRDQEQHEAGRQHQRPESDGAIHRNPCEHD